MLLTRRSFLKLNALAAVCAPRLAEAAVAERSLAFHNLHTSESLKTVYWIQGDYVAQSLAEINHVLRDHRSGETHEIDHRLLDLLHGIRQRLDTSKPFEIISGYRSPATNAMLRGQSDGVAERSLHVQGMAIDVRVPGRRLSLVRKTALSMRAGGVGYYPASQFVHIDVGRVRKW